MSEILEFLTEIHGYVTFRILVSTVAILLYIIRRPQKIKVVYFHPINTIWVYILCWCCARFRGRPRWVIMVPALWELTVSGEIGTMWLTVAWSDKAHTLLHHENTGHGLRTQQAFLKCGWRSQCTVGVYFRRWAGMMVCRLHSIERNGVKVRFL